MTSDLPPTAPQAETPKKASAEILQSEINEGLDVLRWGNSRLFISGLSAGLDLGFSLLLMAVMATQTRAIHSRVLVNLLIANMYSLGFIFVVVGRSELFTEQTTLAVLPVIGRKASALDLLRVWAVILVANLAGGAIFARLVTFIGPRLGNITPEAFREIAAPLVAHASSEIFFSAVFAGWLMGLLSWLVAASRETISQIVIVWLITFSIGFAGLHHVVAGAIEVFAGAFARQGVSGADVVRVIAWTALGNIVGGTVFVAIVKYGHARTGGEMEPGVERFNRYFGKSRRKVARQLRTK